MDAASLWERLVPLHGPALADAVDALHGIEVRILLATARPRLGSATALEVLATVLERRQPDDAGALAWEAYLLSDGHPAFQHVAQGYVRQRAREYPAWDHLVRRGPPSEAALALYHAQQHGFERWSAAPDVALDRWPEFTRRLQAAILAPGTLARLDRREPSAAIAQWAQVAVRAGDRETWYAAFVEETRTNPRPLDHAVLSAVLERFGEPAAGRPFWSGISEAARTAFGLWIMNGRLTHLLGEGERVQFWRRFLAQIKRPYKNRDGQVVFIDLDGAIAVQFVHTGTATYIFPSSAFRHVSRGSDSEVRRSVYDNSHRSLASYEHRGHSWRWSAEAAVRRVLDGLAHA
jgi:hypothetical protein